MSGSPVSADAPGSPVGLDVANEGPLYPLEGKFLSSEDRRRILALPEIERESILAGRAQEEIERRQDIELKKAFAVSEAAASKQQKRKAAAADLDDASTRKSSRAKTEKSGRSALDDYKKAREAKGAERTSRFDVGGRSGRRSRSATSASDRDADGESEVEWAEPASKTRRDEPPADLKDFDRCRIGRTAFAKICFYPNFEETMKGCFARVSIGPSRETGQNMYRMTQIKGELHIYTWVYRIIADNVSIRLRLWQTIRSRRTKWQDLPHGSVCSRCAWPLRKAVAVLSMLRFCFDRVRVSKIQNDPGERTPSSTQTGMATSEA